MDHSSHPKRQILVVDDEPAIATVMEMMLRFDGHDVHVAASSEAAIAILEQTRFDLVITDYLMPKMKGDELAVLIKQRWPELRIIMLTAHADALMDSGKEMIGVDALLGKPFLLDSLRNAIAKSLPTV